MPYRLPSGPSIAFASLAASSHVDWVADTDRETGRPPDGIVQGFAPMWFVGASQHLRTITLVDRSGESGRLIFAGLTSVDVLTLLYLWFASVWNARRSRLSRT